MKPKHSSNGHGHETETPDVSHIRNVDVTHELSDVNTRGIGAFIGGLVLMTVMVYLLMWGMFRVLASQEREKDVPGSPMAMSTAERLPPEPRLQGAPGFAAGLAKEMGKEVKQGEGPPVPKDPLWEIRELRQHWQMILTAGTKDPNGKTWVLPIEEAKQDLLKQGLPVRANEPVVTAGSDLPTAASSGRMSNR